MEIERRKTRRDSNKEVIMSAINESDWASFSLSMGLSSEEYKNRVNFRPPIVWIWGMDWLYFASSEMHPYAELGDAAFWYADCCSEGNPRCLSLTSCPKFEVTKRLTKYKRSAVRAVSNSLLGENLALYIMYNRFRWGGGVWQKSVCYFTPAFWRLLSFIGRMTKISRIFFATQNWIFATINWRNVGHSEWRTVSDSLLSATEWCQRD